MYRQPLMLYIGTYIHTLINRKAREFVSLEISFLTQFVRARPWGPPRKGGEKHEGLQSHISTDLRLSIYLYIYIYACLCVHLPTLGTHQEGCHQGALEPRLQEPRGLRGRRLEGEKIWPRQCESAEKRQRQ